MAEDARYHYVCAEHGPCGSSTVGPRYSPREQRCPICDALVEVWVGPVGPETSERSPLQEAV